VRGRPFQQQASTKDNVIMRRLESHRLQLALTGAALIALAATGACTPAAQGAGGAAAGAPRMPLAASMTPATSVVVGGAPMLPSRTIVDNAADSADHATLVAAVASAGLIDTLNGAGPFTVFAPVDRAFAALPPGTVDNLLQPENRAALTGILTYHVVPGRLDSDALRQRVAAGGGMAELATVSGATLTVKANGPSNLVIEDGQGGIATISTYDVYQANGVIHVLDDVLLPS
jgi:uncharacterized surface protein with fasciclin (FAS1) repeats